MSKDLLKILKDYGLGENEAKVYVTTLELGEGLASTIARRSGLNRTTTYSILKDLKRQGIVNENDKNKVKYFSVVSPQQLLSQIEEKYEKFKSKIPDLLAISEKLGNRSKVQFFEGFEGVKSVYKELISSSDKTLLCFLGTPEIDPQFQEYLSSEFIPRREKHKLKAKVILSSPDSEYAKMNKKLHDCIVIKKPIFNLSNEIVVYGKNKVAILMYATEEMSALIIESYALHASLTSIFELIWETHSK